MAGRTEDSPPTDERSGERTRLLETVRRLLLGPMEQDEVLDNVPPEVDPTDFYLTGILWPRNTAISPREDEPNAVQGAGAAEGEPEDDGVPLFSVFRPSSIGLTCSIGCSDIPFEITLRAARYVAEERPEKGKSPSEGMASVDWRRRPILYRLPVAAEEKPHSWLTSTFLNERGDEVIDPTVAVHVRLRVADGIRIVTATFINHSERPEASRPGPVCLFQASLTLTAVDSAGNGQIVARRSDSAVPGEDSAAGDLLFRNQREFAAGHGISATWPSPVNGAVTSVETSWIPDRAVYGVSRDGHPDLGPLRSRNPSVFAAATLADATRRSESVKELWQLCVVYDAWISAQQERVRTLSEPLRPAAKTHLEQCRRASVRIKSGIDLIATDNIAYRAFTLANAAMDDYFTAPHRGTGARPLIWAPFQLAFFLLTLPSIAAPSHNDRSTLDLLWFPTGGGKTEAYLAITLFSIFHRRLNESGGGDSHVDVLMRYTLRLLTVQQFQRAAAVICRADLIRERNAKELGRHPISIGLYVGQGATPNRVIDGDGSAKNMLEAEAGGIQPSSTPRLLSRCPICDAVLPISSYRVNAAVPAIELRCSDGKCQSKGRILPIHTVDEDIYRERPSLVIGTIDKFAQLPRKREVGVLFGEPSGPPPNLIIQDELHLISGPLGTVTGLYETAIDLLCHRDGRGPKIIGSTATIGGAAHQVRALFDRDLMQFPPPAIDAEDSFFAVRDTKSVDRRYVAISSSGRSPKFLLQSAAAASLIAAQYLIDAGAKPMNLDPYWTVLMYFNSLRELGGAMVMMRDDVPRTIQFFASRLSVTARPIEGEPEELTSRIASTKIPAVLDKLQVTLDADPFKGAAADTVLASNMISVGVDIPRLGLMLVNGQPKTTAEYIQATSRVGRGLPGLVITLLNAARPRDMSHFEHFAHYHDTLYRRVEVTSVTPWSPRARDRALHAVLVAAVRHLAPSMADRFAAVDFKPDEKIVEAILASIRRRAVRAGQAFVAEHDIEQELADIADRWSRRARQHREAGRKLEYWATLNPFNHRPTQDHLMRAAEENTTDPEVWLTPNSMREVEPTAWYVAWPERKPT